MKNIIIYGLGKEFKYQIEQNCFIQNKLQRYRVIGFIDQNKAGEEIVFGSKKYIVKSLEQWNDLSVDGIVITTNKYRDEIQRNLMDYGFTQEQIWPFEKMKESFLNELMHVEWFKYKTGVEVGGPSAVFSNIYKVCGRCDGVNFCSDTIWWQKDVTEKYMYGEQMLGSIFIADATDLDVIPNDTYDFVLSSNNLEHIANPIKALSEFYRIIKKEGIIVIIVPRKQVTFDHKRDCTSFEHILEDYESDIREDDLTHLKEISEKHDYDMDLQCRGKAEFMLRAQKNFENRCLHHHVFDEKCLKNMFEFLNIHIIEFAETRNFYLIIGKK